MSKFEIVEGAGPGITYLRRVGLCGLGRVFDTPGGRLLSRAVRTLIIDEILDRPELLRPAMRRRLKESFDGGERRDERPSGDRTRGRTTGLGQ